MSIDQTDEEDVLRNQIASITAFLESRGWKESNVDFDDHEVTITYETPGYPHTNITFMYQPPYDDENGDELSMADLSIPHY